MKAGFTSASIGATRSRITPIGSRIGGGDRSAVLSSQRAIAETLPNIVITFCG